MRSDNMIGTRKLRERGWTLMLIDKYLCTPDKLVTNMRHKSGPRVKLYSLERVVAAEATPEFAQAQQAAAKRSEAGRKAAESKKKALLASIEEMSVEVVVLELPILLQKSIDEYNFRLNSNNTRNRDYAVPASVDSDPEFLERIQVNYIRHNLTRYDEKLMKVAGRIGVNDAVQLIRWKVYDAIADSYPDFFSECQRQLDRREENYLYACR